VTMKMGPNDASGVVWAIGTFFLVLYMLTNIFRLYLCIEWYTGVGNGRR
jgi:hypothetical protein